MGATPIKMVMFARSFVPDPHVNAIVHCFDHYNYNVESFEIIVLDDNENGGKHASDSPGPSAIRAKIRGNIITQLQALAQGNYVHWQGETEVVTRLQCTESQCGRYRRALDALEKASYSDAPPLKADDLPRYLSKANRGNVIIDVTTLQKHHLVDVVSLSVAIGVKHVHSFDLKCPPTYDDRTLIHNLTKNDDYEYHNLLVRPAVQTSIETIRRWTVSWKLFGTIITIVALGSLALLILEGWELAVGWIGLVSSILTIVSFVAKGLRNRIA